MRGMNNPDGRELPALNRCAHCDFMAATMEEVIAPAKQVTGRDVVKAMRRAENQILATRIRERLTDDVLNRLDREAHSGSIASFLEGDGPPDLNRAVKTRCSVWREGIISAIVGENDGD